MSLQEATEWLQKRWWGIIVAYGIVAALVYLSIWALIEPAGIPESIDQLPLVIKSRFFLHIILTLIISAYITLFLELGLRRANWNNALQSKDENKFALGFDRLTKGLRRIVHLLPSEMKVEDWRMTHEIDRDGTDTLREELTLIPFGEPVYFYFKRFLLPKNSSPIHFTVSAENIFDRTPLVAFELERNERYAYYVILLDPPTTITTPKRIAITCERIGIWNELVKRGEDEGTLTITHQADKLVMELIAPRGYKWKGFHPAPLTGEISIASESISRVIWTLKDVQPKKYMYQVFADKV